jgi:hypothetical protein
MLQATRLPPQHCETVHHRKSGRGISRRYADFVLVPKRLAAEMLLGKHISSDSVTFRQAKKISIKSRPKMWFNADGELVGDESAGFQNSSSRIRFRG